MEWNNVAAAVPVGVLVGIAAKAALDAVTERQRRRHERGMRLLDAGLREAIDFLAAADRLRRSAESVSTAWLALDGAKGAGDEARLKHYHDLLTAAQKRAADATTDAENAYNALRLLVPYAAGSARSYLDFCNSAYVYPDRTGRAGKPLGSTLRRLSGRPWEPDSSERPAVERRGAPGPAHNEGPNLRNVSVLMLPCP